MTTVIENINAYFINMYGKYSNFEIEVQEMVKSFYDPRIEEKGIEKGMEKGKIEGKAEMLIKQLIKKFNTIPDDYKNILMKLPEEKLEIIAVEIFNINDIKEIEKYF